MSRCQHMPSKTGNRCSSKRLYNTWVLTFCMQETKKKSAGSLTVLLLTILKKKKKKKKKILLILNILNTMYTL